MGNRCSIQQSEEINCWLEQSPENRLYRPFRYFWATLYIYIYIFFFFNRKCILFITLSGKSSLKNTPQKYPPFPRKCMGTCIPHSSWCWICYHLYLLIYIYFRQHLTHQIFAIRWRLIMFFSDWTSLTEHGGW